MGDDSAQKSFEPTQSRLAKARSEGNIARSTDLVSTASFAGAAITLAVVLAPIGCALAVILTQSASGKSAFQAVWLTICLALSPLAGAAICAVLVSLLQTKGVIVTGITLRINRMHPVEGIKRMLSRESLTQVLRALTAFSIAALGLSIGLRDSLGLAMHPAGAAQVALGVWQAVRLTISLLLILGALFACLDYGIARKQWLKKLRMSFAEIKRDTREHDGDPQQRGRRRSLAKSMATSSLQAVREAAFILSNPTHIAIALAYAPPDIPVPRVLIRAVDQAALRVRALAIELDVPIIEDVPLARALYAQTVVGHDIPGAYFVALAQIVANLSASGLLR